MIDIAAAVTTHRPRAVPAPAKVAAAGFKDTLDGLSETPAPAPDMPRAQPGPKGKSADPVLAQLVPGKEPAPDVARVIDSATGLPPVKPDIVLVAKDAEPEPCMMPALTGKRQAPAEDGKILPVDDQDDNAEPVWLPVGMMVPMPVARPLTSPKLDATTTGIDSAVGSVVVAPVPTATGAAALTPTPAVPAEAGAQSADGGNPAENSPNSAPASAGAAVNAMATPTTREAPGVPVPRVIDVAKPDLPVRAEATTTPAPPPAPQPQPILPAGQAFAAAIAAAVQQNRDEREPAEPHAPIALATTTLERLHTPVIAAPADARQSALDLRQDSGLQGMIDHIEVLRDGANAGDTRIRLVPDALGAVDVSVRRDGDRLHVHFNAENQASARLIADAQPRLAELADARGVKLGQTSVDSGDGQSPRQQPATPIQFTRPATAADPIDTPDDLRVA